MPFLETGTAARAGRVLGYEDGMPTKWRLLAVIGRICRSEASVDKIGGMVQDGRKAFRSQIGALLGSKVEALPEGRLRQGGEELVHVSHRTFQFLVRQNR
jgi:hypothetical protein